MSISKKSVGLPVEVGIEKGTNWGDDRDDKNRSEDRIRWGNDKRAVGPILSLFGIDTPHHQTNSEGSNERTHLVEFEVVL
jgi:hypothetical protein